MPNLELQDVSETTARKLSEFFAKLSRTSSRALLLDYDGTLAPFSIDRHRALPYPALPDLISRIRRLTDTRVVIVTGRRAFEAAALLGLKTVEVWGCHGLSRLHPDGRYEMPTLPEDDLDKVFEACNLLRKEGLLDLMELKPAAVAVHWRGIEGAATQVAQRVEKVWSMLGSHKGLELLKFDGGMEIRLAGRNKGDAVRAVLAEMGRNSAIAYLGDDHTDEDAFAALHGHGLSVLVRGEYRATRADVWLQPPEGVIAFLTDWANACGGVS